MSVPKYVFCMWNKRLWPAKVLSHRYMSNKCRLSVELFVVKKQLDVNLTDTKPFLKDKLQKIGEILDRKRKRTSTSEDHLYEGAIKNAVNMMKPPSFSASQSNRRPCTKAKGRAQGNDEGSKKKPEKSDSDVSKDVLEISTRCDTGVSPTNGSTARKVQRNKARSKDKRPGEPLCGEETVSDVSSLVNDQKSKPKNIPVSKIKVCTNQRRDTESSTVSLPESGKKGTKKCPVQRIQPGTSKTVQVTNADLKAEYADAETEKGDVPRVARYMKHPMPDFDRKRKRTSTSEDHLYEGAIKNAVNMMKPPSFSASHSKRRPCTKAKGRAQGNDEGSKKKPEKSDSDVSKNVLEISTRCDTGVSPTKGSTARKVQRNKARSKDKRPGEPLCGEETVSDVSSLVNDQKSKPKNIPVSKIKVCTNQRRDTESSTVSLPESGKKGTKKCPVQRIQPGTSKTVQVTNTDLKAEYADAETEKDVPRVARYMKHPMPDFEDEKGIPFSSGESSSELSLDISSPEYLVAMFSSQDELEDVQLPVVMLQKEDAPIISGSFVWCKYHNYPYWPSLVKIVDSKHKKATIVFIDQSISDPTKKKASFKVALRTIKHYDCPEKEQFLENARKDFGYSIDWCDSLISDYRIRLGCGSFTGSFLDYCTADISLPVRREKEGGKREIMFPFLELGTKVTTTQQNMFSNNPECNKKQLPDRSRAARDRANEKLVTFIVNAKEAENHLLDILQGKKTSQWLQKFQSSKQYINCLDTYIEDEQQIELVMGHLQAVCVKMSKAVGNLMHGDQTRFILEVLIPEAVIFAISATEQMSYKEAEAKYLKGPLVSKRERKLFDEQILENKRSKMVKEAKLKKVFK
ncbi:PWWP domain-containing DNA repair factor 3A isoform 2-T5 [Anomaloglossus baeobatrachus]|uniref:PWWP domain-containing DNA repair factor 3A isoform X2 n=1 Tax=Anomaloglossus baeobatrachus TaxID=238106 RepID=UPI003F4F567A